MGFNKGSLNKSFLINRRDCLKSKKNDNLCDWKTNQVPVMLYIEK